MGSSTRDIGCGAGGDNRRSVADDGRGAGRGCQSLAIEGGVRGRAQGSQASGSRRMVCGSGLGAGEWDPSRPGFKLMEEQVHDALIPLPTIPAIPKSLAALAIAECDKALSEGGDEELQLLECCLRVKDAMARS